MFGRSKQNEDLQGRGTKTAAGENTYQTGEFKRRNTSPHLEICPWIHTPTSPKKTTFQAGDFDCELNPKINWNIIKRKKWRKLDVLLIGEISLSFRPTPGQLATAKTESPTYHAASSVTAKKEANWKCEANCPEGPGKRANRVIVCQQSRTNYTQTSVPLIVIPERASQKPRKPGWLQASGINSETFARGKRLQIVAIYEFEKWSIVLNSSLLSNASSL